MALKICDVSPRDGLQNEATVLAPPVRAELCRRLAGAGLTHVQAASFVRPDRVPAMAGAEEVLRALAKEDGVVWSGLVLNERGYERAVAAGVAEVHYGFPVSESFAARNQNTTVEDGLATGLRLIERARADGIPIKIGLIVAFGCPFEGPIPPSQVLGLVERILAAGPDEIGLADTIGVAVPRQVRELVAAALGMGARVGCHFHDTRNTGIANALAAFESGATLLDASVGGSGGCPFAPNATGNIATEDLVYLLEGMGVATGIDLGRLIETSRWLGERLGRPLPSLVARAGPFAAIPA